MARTRAIKPGFFKNEDLAECSPHARLLFAGLWTLADREGRLEDRPRRIGGEIFPYEQLDIDALLSELAARQFILRYTSGDFQCIQVCKFGTHQTPHVKEADSTLPAPDGYETSTVLAPDKSDTSTPRIPSPVNRKPSPVPLAVPTALLPMHRILVLQPGYRPTVAFFDKVTEKYGRIDLEEEAIKACDWLSRNRGRACTTAFMLNWLDKASARVTPATRANGTPPRRDWKPPDFTPTTAPPSLKERIVQPS